MEFKGGKDIVSLERFGSVYLLTNDSWVRFHQTVLISRDHSLHLIVEIVKMCGKFRIKTKKLVIYSAHKC